MSLITVAIIAEKYGMRLDTTQLGKVLGLEASTIRNQISAGTFPITTYVDGAKRYADCRDVAAHLDACREAALRARDLAEA